MVEQTGVRKAAANRLSFNGFVTAMRIQAEHAADVRRWVRAAKRREANHG